MTIYLNYPTILKSTNFFEMRSKKCSKVKISADIGNLSGWLVDKPLTVPSGEN